MKHLAVRNWHKFQHYRERNPVWVKAYVELLDNPDWLALPDAAKGQLFGLWLLAAKRANRIPNDAKSLHVLLGVTGKLYLAELVAGGWLEEVEASDASRTASKPASSSASNSASKAASKPASKAASSDASKPASTSRASARSREGEAETETEGEAPPPAREGSPQVERFLGGMSPSQRESWEHLLAGWREGMGYPGGRAAQQEDIDVGVMEYLALVDERQRDYSPRHVVQFVESARVRRVTGASREGRARASDESTAEQAMRVATALGTLAGGHAA